MNEVLLTIVILGVVLGILVFVHELGHYLAAKAFGVWVHRFAIGIGKPIRQLSFRRGETEWAIAWLPLGGYVKMASREEDPASSVLEGGHAADVPPSRVFEAKPIWQRMVIILAGVTLNTVFAWAIFTGLAWKNGRHYDPTTRLGRVNRTDLPPEATGLTTLPPGIRIAAINGHTVNSWDDIREQITESDRNEIALTFADHDPLTIPLHKDALAERANIAVALEPFWPAVVGALVVSYPARAAGLEPGDSIVAIDGQVTNQWLEAVDRIKASAGKPLHLEVMRAGVKHELEITPRQEREVEGDSSSAMVGRIGANVRTPYLTESLGLVGAVRAGTDASITAAGTIFRTLRGLVSGRVSTRNVGGPILIGQMATDQARAGLEPFLAFLALISINLAVVNLLPIPVLDGGAFLILAVEGLIRRPLPSRLREVVSMVGLAMIVLLMVIAFKNDIGRLLGR